MGFGFNLGMIFIVLPLTAILLLLWLFVRKRIIGYLLALMWGGIFFLVIVSITLNAIFSKKELDKDDFYGEYVIDRFFFKGEQTDWQYNHYRFEITDDDSIHFYCTNGEGILKSYHGTISTVKPYSSARLKIHMNGESHHILTSNPTIDRDTWSFYMVFNSPYYHNMYFTKDDWEPIN